MPGLIRQVFTHISRRADFYLGGLLLLLFIAGVYLVFFRPTAFLFTVRERLLANRELMARIGGANGYEMRGSDKKTTPWIFRITIKGRCPGASLTVRGTYTDTSYTISDTLVTNCSIQKPER